MKSSNFAVFILTNGRPDRVVTMHALEKCGYTGRIVVLIDNMDAHREAYIKNFGDKVEVFDKPEIAGCFDKADNFSNYRAIVYARNACFDVAQRLGITHFVQLDDDYSDFGYTFDPQDKFYSEGKWVRQIDAVFAAYINFLNSTPVSTVAFAQGGDFIGGENGGMVKHGPIPKRKAMNSFFCRTDRRIWFVGTINEDVNTYVWRGGQGAIFLTASFIRLWQKMSQQSAGGMTETYVEDGTYVKSFYTLLFSPSCVKIMMMGPVNPRLHHRISWRHAVPKIIPESFRRV